MKGPVLVALAAACWGLSGGIAGVLLEAGWSPFVIAFYRGAIGLGFFVVWLVLTPGPRGLGSARLWFWSVLAGAGVAGNFSFYFLSIGESSLAVAATLIRSMASRWRIQPVTRWVSLAPSLAQLREVWKIFLRHC